MLRAPPTSCSAPATGEESDSKHLANRRSRARRQDLAGYPADGRRRAACSVPLRTAEPADRRRAAHCAAVLVVVPCGVAPRKHYGFAAIAMALTLRFISSVLITCVPSTANWGASQYVSQMFLTSVWYCFGCSRSSCEVSQYSLLCGRRSASLKNGRPAVGKCCRRAHA